MLEDYINTLKNRGMKTVQLSLKDFEELDAKNKVLQGRELFHWENNEGVWLISFLKAGFGLTYGYDEVTAIYNLKKDKIIFKAPKVFFGYKYFSIYIK